MGGGSIHDLCAVSVPPVCTRGGMDIGADCDSEGRDDDKAQDGGTIARGRYTGWGEKLLPI